MPILNKNGTGFHRQTEISTSVAPEVGFIIDIVDGKVFGPAYSTGSGIVLMDRAVNATK